MNKEIVMIDLGWCMGRLTKTELCIASPSDVAAGVHTPAQSVVILTASALLALRNALNEMFPRRNGV